MQQHRNAPLLLWMRLVHAGLGRGYGLWPQVQESCTWVVHKERREGHLQICLLWELVPKMIASPSVSSMWTKRPRNTNKQRNITHRNSSPCGHGVRQQTGSKLTLTQLTTDTQPDNKMKRHRREEQHGLNTQTGRSVRLGECNVSMSNNVNILKTHQKIKVKVQPLN